MENIHLAFWIGTDGEPIPSIGYQKIRCHLIFDIKQEDFRCKARLVAGGHTTEAPATITYASVVSRETVRIALLLAGLMDLEVKTADIENVYITALQTLRKSTLSWDLSLVQMKKKLPLLSETCMDSRVQV